MKKHQKVTKLIELANNAKNIRLFTLANAVFAVLLEWGLNSRRGSFEEFNGIHLSIETQDRDGSSQREVYYDLLRVDMVFGSFNSCDDAPSLCIPVPLVHSFSMISAMKSKRCVPISRGTHNRNHRAPKSLEAKYLWRTLFDLVDRGEVEQASREHLNEPEELPNFDEFEDGEVESIWIVNGRGVDPKHAFTKWFDRPPEEDELKSSCYDRARDCTREFRSSFCEVKVSPTGEILEFPNEVGKRDVITLRYHPTPQRAKVGDRIPYLV